MRITLIGFLLIMALGLHAQKKVLDHTVYDSWQNIGERKISNDGKWVAYCVDVQEGDGEMVVQSSDGRYVKTFARGYNLQFTEDNQFLVFKIKPTYKDTRQARIKKKKPEDFPKDTLAYLQLGRDTATKIARVKSYKLPEKSAAWLAFLMEKPIVDSSKAAKKDSLSHKLDSLIKTQPRFSGEKKKDEQDAEGDAADAAKTEEGTNLVILDFSTRRDTVLKNITEYYWSKPGNILLMKGTPAKKDSLGKNFVAIWRSHESHLDTISRGGTEFKNFAIDENGYQLAYVAERDSSIKALQKFYKLWYWRNGDDTATMLLDKMSQGMKVGNTISENANLSFSKSGNRLFLGTAPIQPPKDTSLAEIDLVKVDIWNYQDDYLQTQQLKRVDQDLKRNYLGVFHFKTGQFVQLADKYLPQVVLSQEGDGDQFFGASDFGKRVESQWTGSTKKDLFAIDPITGKRTLIKSDLDGFSDLSYTGKYVIWFDNKLRNYFTWSNGDIKNISAKIKAPLVDEENDVPDFPSTYGIMRWLQNDEAVFIYDRFDIWQVDPKGIANPINITSEGRKNKMVYRYIQTDPEEMFIKPGQDLLLTSFDETSKDAGIAHLDLKSSRQPAQWIKGPFLFGRVIKAKSEDAFVYTKENYQQSPNLFVNKNWKDELKLSNTNPQQKDFNWGTASLFSWKSYNGKAAQGIVYKPENFDPTKKYPLICYFYERLTDGLNQYVPPAPTASRLNISFFVSRGYIVLAPDIYYNAGHPGKAAVDYVLSGARALVKKGWVDSTKMGIQGQSWGGYQVAYIITATSAFRAAWAGAPVVNMTSAYGGIRWESGLNRQFQYEKQQSRIGASLWDRPQLYTENSPLFHLPKVKTPVVIMSNDNDGAVPWYQGIEMFTALRRLGKPVWLLNYNGEAHNLVERKNRKDIQVREQQFFDWLLKGDREPQWLKEGVPATEKGRQWGFQLQ